MKLIIRPLTPDLWPALEDLFGKDGASNGCWCIIGALALITTSSRARKTRPPFEGS